MARYGPGYIMGMGLLGLGVFTVVDHFVLKDKFGIWLKLEELFKGFAPHSAVPLGTSSTGSELFAVPSKVGKSVVAGTKAVGGAISKGKAGVTLGRTPKAKTPRTTAGAGAGVRVGVKL